MASLLPYADAVMRQRMLANTNQEVLAKRLADLQATRNRRCLNLPISLAAVEGDSDELQEQREKKQQLVNELAQYRLELHTRTMCLGGAMKKRDAVNGFFVQVESSWVGYPAKIVHVARALQERRVLLKEAVPFIQSLCDLRERVLLSVRVVCAGSAVETLNALHHTHLTGHQDSMKMCLQAATAMAVQLTTRASAVVCTRQETRAAADSCARLAVEEAASGELICMEGEFLYGWRAALMSAAQVWEELLSSQAADLETCNARHDATLATHAALRDTTARTAAQENADLEMRASERARRHERLTDTLQEAVSARQCGTELTARCESAMHRADALGMALRGSCWLLASLRQTQHDVSARRETEMSETRRVMQAKLDRLRAAHELQLDTKRRERQAAQQQQALVAVEGEETLKRRSLLQQEATEWMQLSQTHRACHAQALSAAAAREAVVKALAVSKPRKTRAKRLREGSVYEDLVSTPAARAEWHRTTDPFMLTKTPTRADGGRRRGKVARPPVSSAISALHAGAHAPQPSVPAAPATVRPRAAVDGAATQTGLDGAAGEADTSFDSTEDVITATKPCPSRGTGPASAASPKQPSPSPAPRAPRGANASATAVRPCTATFRPDPARHVASVYGQGPLPRPAQAHHEKGRPLRPAPAPVPSIASSRGALSSALGRTKTAANKPLFSSARPFVAEARGPPATNTMAVDSLFTDFIS